MNVRYWVELSEAERVELRGLLSSKRQPVRRVKRAQILLASDLGQSEEAIARAVGVGISTVYRTRRRFVEGNLEGALSEEARAGAARKLSGTEEALLVATACSKAPAGCALDAEIADRADVGVDRTQRFIERNGAPAAACE